MDGGTGQFDVDEVVSMKKVSLFLFPFYLLLILHFFLKVDKGKQRATCQPESLEDEVQIVEPIILSNVSLHDLLHFLQLTSLALLSEGHEEEAGGMFPAICYDSPC